MLTRFNELTRLKVRIAECERSQDGDEAALHRPSLMSGLVPQGWIVHTTAGLGQVFIAPAIATMFACVL